MTLAIGCDMTPIQGICVYSTVAFPCTAAEGLSIQRCQYTLPFHYQSPSLYLIEKRVHGEMVTAIYASREVRRKGTSLLRVLHSSSSHHIFVNIRCHSHFSNIHPVIGNDHDTRLIPFLPQHLPGKPPKRFGGHRVVQKGWR